SATSSAAASMTSSRVSAAALDGKALDMYAYCTCILRCIKTALALWGDRHFPASVVAEQGKALHAAGVDGVLLADQFGNFIPPQLWTTDVTPSAAVLPDPDSHSDVFALGGYLLAAAPGLDLAVSTDSVRRPPAELVQAMLTL